LTPRCALDEKRIDRGPVNAVKRAMTPRSAGATNARWRVALLDACVFGIELRRGFDELLPLDAHDRQRDALSVGHLS